MNPGVTVDELVKAAKRAGYANASKRLVYYWTKLGLLDAPTPISKGRGGRRAFFSADQRDLFLQLCGLHARIRRERHVVAHLCHVPVFLWLWCGSPCIPLRQTRRALATWTNVEAGSWRRCVEWAYELLHPFGWSRRRGRPPALVHRLATLLYRHQITQANLTDALLRAVAQAPEAASPSLVQQWIRRTPNVEPAVVSLEEFARDVGRTLGTRHEISRQLTELPDSMFEWARVMFLRKYPRYLAQRLGLPFVPNPGDILTKLAPQFDEIEWRACYDLVDTLGYAREATRRHPGTLADPRVWERLQLHIEGLQVISPAGIVLHDLHEEFLGEPRTPLEL
jgi:hypothetical protein